MEPTGVPGVVLSVPEGLDPRADSGLVDAGGRPPSVVVALGLQAEAVTGGVVVLWGGVVVLWQIGRGEPASAEAAG